MKKKHKKWSNKTIRRTFDLEKGESLFDGRNEEPELSIVSDGAGTYIWIGGGGCFATLSGVKTLERLATSILRATNSLT